ADQARVGGYRGDDRVRVRLRGGHGNESNEGERMQEPAGSRGHGFPSLEAAATDAVARVAAPSPAERASAANLSAASVGCLSDVVGLRWNSPAGHTNPVLSTSNVFQSMWSNSGHHV